MGIRDIQENETSDGEVESLVCHFEERVYNSQIYVARFMNSNHARAQDPDLGRHFELTAELVEIEIDRLEKQNDKGATAYSKSQLHELLKAKDALGLPSR